MRGGVVLAQYRGGGFARVDDGVLGDAEGKGATLALNSKVTGGSVGSGDGRGLVVEVEGTELSCGIVVNCAGLHAGNVSSWFLDRSIKGVGVEGGATRRHYYAKGNYYRLEGQKSPFRHLVYPVPVKGGLGVHATIDLGGNTRCES